MTLKRITACVLCMILAMALTAPAIAEDPFIEYDLSNEVQQSCDVSYKSQEFFYAKIPTSISIRKQSDGSLAGSTLLSIDACEPVGKSIQVKINDPAAQGNAADNPNWVLTHSNGSKIAYNIYSDFMKANVSKSGIAMVFDGSGMEKTVSTTLTFSIPKDNQNIVLGDYSGIITFSLVPIVIN